MEQMYLIEIFIDKVTIFSSENEETTTNKNLITKVKFGPKVQFIIKEGQLAVNEKREDTIVTDEKTGRKQWSRTIRVGKSLLFPSYPDTLLGILSTFPLEIEVWNDDENESENQIYVGVGNMLWDTKFYVMLKETSDICKLHEPLAIKSKVSLKLECCCKEAGEVNLIFRLSALGDGIITEFQQIMNDPESFVFRTNKAPSMFQCKRVEGDNPNFCMVGSLYETTTLEDPETVANAKTKIEVCTELQSCGISSKGGPAVCDHHTSEANKPSKKKYAIDKIRMGDITGPCGNKNCALAHKVRKYIRNLDSYKEKAACITDTKPVEGRSVCGKCVCKDDRWHRDDCPEDNKRPKVRCIGCDGMTLEGQTCKDKKDKHFGTGSTPKTSDTNVVVQRFSHSITRFPNYKQGMFGHDTIVENCFCTKYNSSVDINNKACSSQDLGQSSTSGCCCRKSTTKPLESRETMLSIATNGPIICNLETNSQNTNRRSSSKMPNSTVTSYQTLTSTGTSNQMTNSTGTNYTTVYNVGTSAGNNTENKRKLLVYNCTEILDEKDCRCNPEKRGPPCRTFDCDCLTEVENIASRKAHRPYCPSYKHKLNCPVTMMNEEEEQKKVDEDEEETTPLPYGLPPILLGPCPVLGRPCTVPDGFARMYKNALLPTQPFSYSDEGKVCCSKEFDRIKKAIKEYTKNDKGHDFRCINKFNLDTERRCCDKEQMLLSLMGKECCGSHKKMMQEKYAEEKKQP